MSELHKLSPVTGVWQLAITPTAPGIAAMFRGPKLHSLAVVGQSLDGFVTVPLALWSQLRQMASVAHVPSSVYVVPEEEGKPLWFAAWPEQAGLGYSVRSDPVHGCVVAIPKAEFKPVVRKDASNG